MSAGIVSAARAARAASAFERRARRALLDRLATLPGDRLRVLEDGVPVDCGPGGGLEATVRVHDPRFWTEAALGGSLGAAESYVRGEWDADDLTTVVRILARHRDTLAALDRGPAALLRPIGAIARALHRNTRHGARANIAAHYDLGNDFFRLFLDRTLMYSSAIFASPEATLEEASVHKLDVVCRRLGLRPGMEVVEIGSGWGGFAVHAAARWGARVTTTTISAEQHRETVARVAAAGLGDRVTVLREDYRDLPRRLGRRFDRLVSIEMIEAVGGEFLGGYFEVLGRLLAPEGLGLVQAIVIRDQDQPAYRRSHDFIRKHIFPGGELPSVTSMVAAATGRSPLRIAGLDDWTPHYARTLALWRERFHANAPALERMGFDETFRRTWHWYFCSCEAGFLERTIGLVHLHLAGARARTGPLAAEAGA